MPEFYSNISKIFFNIKPYTICILEHSFDKNLIGGFWASGQELFEDCWQYPLFLLMPMGYNDRRTCSKSSKPDLVPRSKMAHIFLRSQLCMVKKHFLISKISVAFAVSKRNLNNWEMFDVINMDTVLCCTQSLSHVQLFVTPWIVAHRPPRSMRIAKSQTWLNI